MSSKPIYFDKVFEAHYQKRILKDKRLHELYKQAITIFIDNPANPKLHTHELKGRMSTKKAFTVDDDCRVVYVEDKESIIFLDIGKHDEVYK
jgi:addiction module RelE/StbE family toxin